LKRGTGAVTRDQCIEKGVSRAINDGDGHFRQSGRFVARESRSSLRYRLDDRDQAILNIAGDIVNGDAVELAGRAANSKALWAHARDPHAK